LRRAAVLVLGAVAVVLLWRAGEAPVQALETPELRQAPEVFEEPLSTAERAEIQTIGSFERPERVPTYEILEELPTGRAGARSARLLVDTRSRSQADLTLITRDLKARYALYDLVSVEFTDTSVVLDYNGGAVIVNTPVGSRRAGFIFAPPNEGYYVVAAR
jgi:hypothetical protein